MKLIAFMCDAQCFSMISLDLPEFDVLFVVIWLSLTNKMPKLVSKEHERNSLHLSVDT